jgi:hypothetical protein
MVRSSFFFPTQPITPHLLLLMIAATYMQPTKPHQAWSVVRGGNGGENDVHRQLQKKTKRSCREFDTDRLDLISKQLEPPAARL